jgi:hypothetical protein
MVDTRFIPIVSSSDPKVSLLPEMHKESLLHPSNVMSRADVLTIYNCPLPKQPGVYAWYFKEVAASVPTEGCHMFKGLTLLYVGISPKAPPSNGKPPSRQKLFHRIRYHMRGNAEGSTLRLSLGCLLTEQLGIELQRVGNGKRMTFAEGEQKLSEWMEVNAYVAFAEYTEPWKLEEELIRSLSLPLNLDMNSSHPFHATLSRIRREAKSRARDGPIAR